MACKYFNECDYKFKKEFCSNSTPTWEAVWKDCSAYLKFKEQEESYNPYWENVCEIAKKQRKKGFETYGQRLEDNHWDIVKRLEYLEEELVDSLMYLEWVKDYLSKHKPDSPICSKCQYQETCMDKQAFLHCPAYVERKENVSK